MIFTHVSFTEELLDHLGWYPCVMAWMASTSAPARCPLVQWWEATTTAHYLDQNLSSLASPRSTTIGIRITKQKSQHHINLAQI